MRVFRKEKITGEKNSRPLRAVVVGAGYFGRIHARKYSELETVEFLGVVDMDLEKAKAVADEFGVRAYGSLDAILGEADVVTVAVPARAHYAVALQALEAGVHTLVEKPVALTTEEADHLVRVARRKGLALQVGHQERYVLQQFGLLSRDVAPSYVECRRAGPFSGRCMDVSVVLDLMIHDIDLVHQVAPAPVTRVDASGLAVHGDLTDEAAADLTLEDGCTVRLVASRNAQTRERSMKLVYPDGEVVIDFVRRTLTNTTGATLVAAFGGDQQIAGAPAIANDPVGYGVRQFVECAREGREPQITGECGRKALDTALRIEAAIDQAAEGEAVRSVAI